MCSRELTHTQSSVSHWSVSGKSASGWSLSGQSASGWSLSSQCSYEVFCGDVGAVICTGWLLS